MRIKDQLVALAEEKNAPCVTISFNTHRTLPNNQQDPIKLKNLIREAEERILKDYDKREVSSLLEKLNKLPDEMEVSKNLESLNIYVSKDTFEFIRTTWAVSKEGVWVDDTFALNPLIKAMNRNEEYLVLYLTQKGVHLYNALNNSIVEEIVNDDFPFTEAKYSLSHVFADEHNNDLQQNRLKNFINHVDKAVLKVDSSFETPVLVVAVADNYSTLLEEADRPSIYVGNISVDFNSPTQQHEYMQAAWTFIKNRQHKQRTQAINEVKEAVNQGQVITDLQEIYQAAIDGRGDLLIVHEDFEQSVRMTSDRTFEIVDQSTDNDVVDDITSTIAWNVIAKKGRVIFTNQEEIKALGTIALKTRY